MRRILIGCAALCLCLSPAIAGPKDAHKDKGSACATCKDIHKTGEGWCDHCNSGMVCHISVKDKKIYEGMKDSKYAQVLEKGEAVKVAEVKCPDCKKLYESHKDGWCKKCDGGMVAGRFFKGKAAYDKAVDAERVLTEASKMHCEGCGVACASDGKCAHCKVSYKDGKKV
ncbi:MAG TPA: hypothetical protein VMV81_00750 [Phycisphaerae bacterium]|nr:hypothetical protein [Phycisphaerae bacterium]